MEEDVIYRSAHPVKPWLHPFWAGLGLGSASGSGVLAPLVRGTPTKGNLSNSSSVTLPSFSPGDYLFVVMFQNASVATDPGTPAGWTRIAAGNSGSADASIWGYTKKAVVSDTFTFSNTVSNGVFNAYAIMNCQSVAGLDWFQKNQGTTSPMNALTVNSMGNNDLMIASYAAFGIGPVIGTPSAGTPTAQQTNSSVGIVSAYESLKGATAPPTRTATLSGSTDWSTLTVAFQ